MRWPNGVSCHQGREADGTLPLERQGSEFGNPLTGETKLSWFQPATKSVSLSSPACDDAWRQFMAKRYSGNEFASVAGVTQCSSSARTAIADSAIAAPRAVSMPEPANDGAPTAVTKRAPKDGLIIATRQRDYRCRRRQAPSGVTDQGSLSITSPASFEGGPADPQESPPISQSWPEVQPALLLRCRICGRMGRLIDPFPRTPRRK